MWIEITDIDLAKEAEKAGFYCRWRTKTGAYVDHSNSLRELMALIPGSSAVFWASEAPVPLEVPNRPEDVKRLNCEGGYTL